MGPVVPLLAPEPAPEPPPEAAPALAPEPPPEPAPEPPPEPLLEPATDEPLAAPLDPFPLPLTPPLPDPLPLVAAAPEPLPPAEAGPVGFDEQLPSTRTPATHAPIANKGFGFMEFTRVRMLNGCSRRAARLGPQRAGKTQGHRQGVSHVGEMQSCIMFHNGPASGGKQLLAQSSESVAPSGAGAASMSKVPPSGSCPL